MRWRGYPLLLLLGVLTVTGGCTSSPPQPPAPKPITWREVPLPDPQAIVRDLLSCGGKWIASGAVRVGADPTSGPNEQTAPSYHPALWSWDGKSWQAIATKPVSYYGERAILGSVTCDGEVLVAVGSASGGAHGNARITTWRGGLSGPLDEMTAPNRDFALFGGPDAVGIGRVVSFAEGFAIVGNWLSKDQRPSPAIWLSQDGKDWKRLVEDPALVSTADTSRRADDLMASSDGLIIVGTQRVGGQVKPLAAASLDGVHWSPMPVPGNAALQRAGVLLLGLDGQTLRSWKPADDGWAATGSFTPDAGSNPVGVTSLASVDQTVLAGVCGGSTCGLWRTDDEGANWGSLGLPASLDAGPSSQVHLAASDTSVLLATEDGKNTRIYYAETVA